MFEHLRTLEKLAVHHLSHNDLDGYGPQIISKFSKVNTISYNHLGYEEFEDYLAEKISFFENFDVLNDHAILITDIAPKSKELVSRLNQLHYLGLTVVLLDHHDTSKWIADEYPEWAFIDSKIQEKLTCGTELYYLYLKEKGLYSEIENSSTYLRDFVEQVRSYDTWDWNRTGNQFAKELNSLVYTVGPYQFMDIQEEKIKENISATDLITYSFNDLEKTLVRIENKKENQYIKSRDKNLKVQSWKIDRNTYKVGIVFGDQYVSVLGNEINKNHKELDFVVILDLNQGKGSLRTIHDTVHVGKISKTLFSGGGHQKAGGFEFNTKDILLNIQDGLGIKFTTSRSEKEKFAMKVMERFFK